MNFFFNKDYLKMNWRETAGASKFERVQQESFFRWNQKCWSITISLANITPSF